MHLESAEIAYLCLPKENCEVLSRQKVDVNPPTLWIPRRYRMKLCLFSVQLYITRLDKWLYLLIVFRRAQNTFQRRVVGKDATDRLFSTALRR